MRERCIKLSCLWVNVDLEYWTQGSCPQSDCSRLVMCLRGPWPPVPALSHPGHFFKGIYSDLSLCFWVPGSDPWQPAAACCPLYCSGWVISWVSPWGLNAVQMLVWLEPVKEAWGTPQRRLSNCWSWQFCCFERQQISGKEEISFPWSFSA